jgi:hypothetical protein
LRRRRLGWIEGGSEGMKLKALPEKLNGDGTLWRTCFRSSPNPKNSPIHPSIVLAFTFFRGDLRTSLTLDVGEDIP